MFTVYKTLKVIYVVTSSTWQNFKEVINIGMTVEFSKTENKLISASCHQVQMYQVCSRTTEKLFNVSNGNYQKKVIVKLVNNLITESLKHKCCRFNERHRANSYKVC